jgi:ankyrin repeat protein
MLLWAVRTENTPVVMALLAEESIGLDVNARGPDNVTPLNLAAAEGHLPIVKLLLEYGACPDDRTANKVTPLMSAVYHEQTAVVRLLAALNKDKPDAVRLDGPDNDGKTPLILAAERGYDGVVKVLLDHGANKDARDTAGMTAMAHAAKKGYSAVIDQLLVHGANPNLKDKENATPLLWASCRNKESVVRQLLARDDLEVDAVDYENMTAFMWAIERRYSTIAELLAERLDLSRTDMIQQVLLWLKRRRISTPSGTGEEDYGNW